MRFHIFVLLNVFLLLHTNLNAQFVNNDNIVFPENVNKQQQRQQQRQQLRQQQRQQERQQLRLQLRQQQPQQERRQEQRQQQRQQLRQQQPQQVRQQEQPQKGRQQVRQQDRQQERQQLRQQKLQQERQQEQRQQERQQLRQQQPQQLRQQEQRQQVRQQQPQQVRQQEQSQKGRQQVRQQERQQEQRQQERQQEQRQKERQQEQRQQLRLPQREQQQQQQQQQQQRQPERVVQKLTNFVRAPALASVASASAWSTSFTGTTAIVPSILATAAFIQDYNNNYHQFNVNPLYEPHRPNENRYRDFMKLFEDIDSKSEPDYNTKMEDNETVEDINGRSIVAPGQYPHMAAVGYRNHEGELVFKCGGSLINELFVLTAAHCCDINGAEPNVIKFGDIFLKEREDNVMPQRRRVANIYIHPYYNTSYYYNDIAIIQLNRPIEYSHYVHPIRLWTSHEIPYEKVHTMGYGSTKFGQPITNILTELEKSIVPNEKCKSSYPPDQAAPSSIIESQICAQDFEKKRDTCQGDSGGPLQLNLERRFRRRRYRYYLVGITSYGKVCRTNNPGVYTRVSSYIDWIASIVWPDYFNQ